MVLITGSNNADVKLMRYNSENKDMDVSILTLIKTASIVKFFKYHDKGDSYSILDLCNALHAFFLENKFSPSMTPRNKSMIFRLNKDPYGFLCEKINNRLDILRIFIETLANMMKLKGIKVASSKSIWRGDAYDEFAVFESISNKITTLFTGNRDSE